MRNIPLFRNHVCICDSLIELSKRVIRSDPVRSTTSWWFSESIQPYSLFNESKKIQTRPGPPRVGGLNGLAHRFT